MKNLLYFILTYDHHYVDMLDMLLKSILLYSKINFDILIITNERLAPKIDAIKSLKKFKYYYHIVPVVDNLYDALKYKSSIFDFEYINNYDRILFSDVDIIVQNDISILFDSKKTKLMKGVLYAPHESNGTHLHKFWSLMKYSKDELKYFNREGIQSFNVGTMLFMNCKEMRTHFENLNKMMKTSKLPHFYEQSFFNHYFNLKNASDTKLLTDKVVIFPIANTYYSHPIFVHFAGIGMYEYKIAAMTEYLKLLKKNKHHLLLL